MWGDCPPEELVGELTQNPHWGPGSAHAEARRARAVPSSAERREAASGSRAGKRREVSWARL